MLRRLQEDGGFLQEEGSFSMDWLEKKNRRTRRLEDEEEEEEEKKEDKKEDGFSMDWLACLAQGWLLMFMAVFGVYLSLREMMMEVNHRMALLGLEIITFTHYLVTGCLVATGPWADDEARGKEENGPDYNLFLTSFGQMMFIIGVALGLVHVGTACERKAMREKQAKVNAALR